MFMTYVSSECKRNVLSVRLYDHSNESSDTAVEHDRTVSELPDVLLQVSIVGAAAAVPCQVVKLTSPGKTGSCAMSALGLK